MTGEPQGGGGAAAAVVRLQLRLAAARFEAEPFARWLALRVLASVAAEQGWSDDRRDRLRRYREDASPLVADEAALLFPPDPPAPK